MFVRKIGVISDTHGLIREEINEFLKGCDLILHAGDIIKEDIIDELEKICKVEAVRGNNDYMLPLDKYPEIKKIIVNENIKICMIHDINEFSENIDEYDIIIHGHTHKSSEEYKNNTLILNPGSFGPVRFSLPTTLATIEFDEGIKVKFYQI